MTDASMTSSEEEYDEGVDSDESDPVDVAEGIRDVLRMKTGAAGEGALIRRHGGDGIVSLGRFNMEVFLVVLFWLLLLFRVLWSAASSSAVVKVGFGVTLLLLCFKSGGVTERGVKDIGVVGGGCSTMLGAGEGGDR